MKSRATQLGYTLLESLYALVIVTLMIALSVRQIESYELNNNINIIQANVDNLFAAAGQYYRANCNTTLNVATGTSLAVPISSLIFKPYGYSTIAVNTAGGLVNTTDTTGGYVVQFNSIATNTQNTNCGWKDCSASASPVAPTQNTLSTNMPVYFLQIQVSVLLKNSKAISNVTRALAPACLSSATTTSPTTISTCTGTTPAGAMWLVFTRLPSYASPHAASGYWGMMPMLKEFNLQYTHDQMYELSGTYYDIGSPPATALQGNYVCGE